MAEPWEGEGVRGRPRNPSPGRGYAALDLSLQGEVHSPALAKSSSRRAAISWPGSARWPSITAE